MPWQLEHTCCAIGALRRTLADLDDHHLVADAARSAALLARRPRIGPDRLDAEQRLRPLADHAYLRGLAEEW